MRKPILLMLTLANLYSFALPCYANGYSPRIGRPHPDFVLPDIATGAPVSLSQFRGRKVLLVHFASW